MNAEYKVAICPQCGGWTVASHVDLAEERRGEFLRAYRAGDSFEYVTRYQFAALVQCPGHEAGGQEELFGGAS